MSNSLLIQFKNFLEIGEEFDFTVWIVRSIFTEILFYCMINTSTKVHVERQAVPVSIP